MVRKPEKGFPHTLFLTVIENPTTLSTAKASGICRRRSGAKSLFAPLPKFLKL